MKRLSLVLLAVLLAGCTTPAIVADQLQRNATELLAVNDHLSGDCMALETVTRTPSSWWSWVAPVRQVTTTVACTYRSIEGYD